MTTPLFPAPLPAWAKAALYLEPLAFQAGQALFDYFSGNSDPDDFAWLHVVYQGSRTTPVGTSEDKASCSWDIVNLTAGAVDATWESGEYVTIANTFSTMLGLLAGYQANNFTWNEYKFYLRRFNSAGPGFADMGDPVVHNTLSVTGSGSSTNALPYQCAMSVTERTTLARHWGRFYLPNPAPNIMTTYGRFSQAACDGVADIVGDTYADLAALDFHVTVPSAARRMLSNVTSIQVDDVPDVQRRRRPRQTLIRAVFP